MNYNPIHFLKEFRKKKALVVGDVMLDEYIDGSAVRISPEAPIPVLLQKSVTHCLGGAGNVAGNAAALGASVTLIGVTGRDSRGSILLRLARAKKIRPLFLVDRSRPTTTKVRFVSDHHQLVRIDIEEARPLSPLLERRMVRAIQALPAHDIVIVSDYAKGSITKPVLSALKKKFGAENIVADMKPMNAHLFRGVRVIAPNVKEAALITGMHATSDELAEKVTKQLSAMLKTSVLLTRGEFGVTVRERGKIARHVAAEVQTVRDVTGAGDTMVATLALMLASGAGFLEAAETANRAAGIVVGIGGTHALTGEELEEAVQKKLNQER